MADPHPLSPEEVAAARSEFVERERAAAGRPFDTAWPPFVPKGESPFSAEQVRQLGEPLDPKRIKTRKGYGSGSLSYLETHDVKRTLNRIFGFGNWGHEIVVQEELGAVEVAHSKDANKKGWHVGYRCVVRLSVRGAVPACGSGYGDGVEYGPAARVTAQELALKESESDALKRAAVALGDQFGLILYAKDEDQARLARDQAADESRRVSDLPLTIKEAIAKLELYTGDPKPWIAEGYAALHDGKKIATPLPAAERDDLIRRLQNVVNVLDTSPEVQSTSPVETLQAALRGAFSAAFEGVEIKGPDPFVQAIPF